MDPSLTLALFTYSTKPRGGVVHTIELAEALQKQGHSAKVFALDKAGTGFFRPLACAYQSVPATPAPAGIDLLIRQRIQEYVDFLRIHLKSYRYDIYHAQDCISANALILLRDEGRIPHIFRTVHHIEAFVSPYLRDCQDRSIREADDCLVVSRHWQTQLEKEYGIPSHWVPNGIRPERFQDFKLDQADILTFKQQQKLTGWPIFLTVGGIEPRKNALGLLEAFAMILKDFPQAQLVIAGGETMFDYQTYRDTFFSRAHTLGILSSLRVTGSLSDINLARCYRAADSFVFPSLKEGWGLVVLEALVARLPVVISGIPPFTEFLEEGQAIFVDPEDPASIASGMKTSVDPVVAQNLVTASQGIPERYTWERSAAVHLEVYRQRRQASSAI